MRRRRDDTKGELRCLFDLNSKISSASQEFAEFYQCEPNDLVGLGASDVGPGRLGRDIARAMERCKFLTISEPANRWVEEGLDYCGRRYWTSWTERARYDEQERFRGVELIGLDVTQEQMRAEQARYEASRDPLTGLLNQQTFDQNLQAAIRHAKSHQSPFGLLVAKFDLPGVGTSRGDEQDQTRAQERVFEEAAERVVAVFRRTDSLGRIGTATIGVLCADLPSLQVLTALRQRMDFAIGEPMLRVSGPAIITRCATLLGSGNETSLELLDAVELQISEADSLQVVST